jgi:beta-phosphoglucomutase-like phosphatase (HAD superfamily)
MSAPPLRGLLVDLDGTLADTAAANHAAYAAALREQGVEVDRATFDAAAGGRNWRQFLPGLLGVDKAARAADVAARKAVLYPAMTGEIRVNTGLVALIEAGVAAGMRAALVTTASRRAVDDILAAHDLARLFRATVTGDDVSAHKPDPEPYLKGAAALGLPAESCLAFEDTELGARSARVAGCQVLMVASLGLGPVGKPD